MKTKRTWLLRLMGLSVMAGAQMLSSLSARAVEVSETIESNRALQAQVESRLAAPLKGVAPNLTDIVRNRDGSVSNMNQYDADSYCRNQGQRLPTVRELALYAQSLGAQGVRKTEKKGYRIVQGSDTAGNPDHFYYSNKGYQPPAGDLGMYSFWSSSNYPKFSNSYAYHMSGDDGYIDGGNRSLDYGSAVRCVRSR